VVVPLVVIVGFQSAWAYACRIDGKVRGRCCCKVEKRERTEREAPDGTSRIAARSCCDVTFHEQSKTQDARESVRWELAHFDVVIPIATAALVVPRVDRAALATTAARAPPRVPIFLDKHAILR
jgi:hypothetical protein